MSVGGGVGNPQYFKAWTKDGHILEYGNTANSRLETQAGTAVISWAVSRLSDTLGNHMTFTYTEDNANGESRLERIDYTGNTAANTAPNNSVRLTYESRLDAEGSYIGAQHFKTPQRLAKIESFAGNALVRDYRLTYASQASANDASRVVEIESCAGSGDCLRKTTLQWDVANQANGIAMTNWLYAQSGQYEPFAIADMNGDGRGDLIVSMGNAYKVLYSTGAGFGAPVSLGAVKEEWYGDSGAVWPPHPVVGDLNGDGRADLLIKTSWGYSNKNVLLSTGSGYVEANWPHAQYEPFAIADMNGDGRGDLIARTNPAGSNNPYQYYVVFYSTGAGFSGPVSLGAAAPEPYGETGRWPSPAVGDLNEDGRADLLIKTSWMDWTLGATNNTLLSNPLQPDSVRSIETGLGAVTTVSYKPLTDASVYSKDSGAVYPYMDVQAPLYVVSSVSVSDGLGGSHVTDYTYAGAKSHQRGGGFLGFRQVVARDAQSGLRNVTAYRQDYPYQGQPLSTRTLTGGGILVSRTLITYTDQLLDTGKSPVWHRSLPTRTVETSYELTGGLISTVTTDTAYDAWANPTAIVVDSGGGYGKTTTHTYDNIIDPDRWFLGRLRRSTVTSVTP